MISHLWQIIWQSDWNIARRILILISSRITFLFRYEFFAIRSRNFFESRAKYENLSIWTKLTKQWNMHRYCNLRSQFSKSMFMLTRYKDFCNQSLNKSFRERSRVNMQKRFEIINAMTQSKTHASSNDDDSSRAIRTI